jgi:hypothetical protein
LTTRDPETPPTNRREPPADRSFWELLPRRNFRRAVFLLVALVAIIAIKRIGGFSFAKLFDDVAPAPAPAPAPKADPSFQHLEVKP